MECQRSRKMGGSCQTGSGRVQERKLPQRLTVPPPGCAGSRACHQLCGCSPMPWRQHPLPELTLCSHLLPASHVLTCLALSPSGRRNHPCFIDGETEGKIQGAATDCLRLRLSPNPGWPIPLPGDHSRAHPGPLPLLQVMPVAGPLVARVAQGASARLSWAAGSSVAPNQLFG